MQPEPTDAKQQASTREWDRYERYRRHLLELSSADARREFRRLSSELKTFWERSPSSEIFEDWRQRALILDSIHGSQLASSALIFRSLAVAHDPNQARVALYLLMFIAIAVVWALGAALNSPSVTVLGSLLIQLFIGWRVTPSAVADRARASFQLQALNQQGDHTKKEFTVAQRSRYVFMAHLASSPGLILRMMTYAAGFVLGATAFSSIASLIVFPFIAPLSAGLMWIEIRKHAVPPYALLLARSRRESVELHVRMREVHAPSRVVSLLDNGEADVRLRRRIRSDCLRAWPEFWTNRAWPHIVGNLVAASSVVAIDARDTESGHLNFEVQLLRSLGVKWVQFGGADGLDPEEYFRAYRGRGVLTTGR